jgi:hypothetical protein
MFQLLVLMVYVGVYFPTVDPIWYSFDAVRNPLYTPVVIIVKPVPAVTEFVLDVSNVPMTKSLGCVVVIEALAVPLLPLFVWAVPSNGEAVLAPDTANAVAAQWLAPPLRDMLIVIDPAEGIMAYHVSRLSTEFVMLALLAQVKLGDDVIAPNVWLLPMAAET